ncbi:MAG: FecR domain-containing protein [Archangium sp.]|nr:FecR domain-containing protein [Archangium sp.]
MKIPMLVIAALLSHAAYAADRCGGVKLEGGSIRLGKPVTEEWVKTAEGKGCLQDLVKEVERYRLVRAITVAAIVTDADRANGKGLAGAKAIAAAIVEAGMPKARVFGLAPAPQRGEALGISLRFVERAPEDVVARVAAVGGSVFLGAEEASLKPAEPGMPVLVNELVKTGPNAKVTIHLKDGSGIEVKPESMIKMPVLQISPTERQVKIEVLSGGIVADVRKATQQSRFEASSRVSVASVRGTVFRFGVEDDGATRLETLEGLVAITPAATPNATPIEVPAGQGTVVSAEGKVSPPRPLPGAPLVTSPLKGPLGGEARFEWQPVADVASYRVEIARDADFLVEARSANVTQVNTLSWAEALPKGKWFWRVTGVNGDGFTGPTSKVYAFTVGK